MRFATVSSTVAVALMLIACGKKEEAAPAPAPTPAVTPAPAPAPATGTTATTPATTPTTTAAAGGGDLELGKSAYGKACALCHAAGVGGAPKPTDKDDWAPRIAQGNDTLYEHAIKGYTGKKGVMPAKGGSSLPDADVKAAVDYMVAQAK